MSTPATLQPLERLPSSAYQLTRLDTPATTVTEVALATSVEPERLVKALVIDAADVGPVLALLFGHRRLDLKKLATAVSAKRCRFMPAERVLQVTGTPVGEVVPLPMGWQTRTLLDVGRPHDGWMIGSGGASGVLLWLDVQEYIRAFAPQIADISLEVSA